MFLYSKWIKEVQLQNTVVVPQTTILPLWVPTCQSYNQASNWQIRPKKKLLYWRNPTDPKIRPDPTFFFFKPKKKKSYFGSKNVNFGVWDLVGSLKCVFLYVFYIPAEISILPKMSQHSSMHWADDMKCLINSVKNSSSKKKKSLPTYPIFVQPITPI